MKKKLVSALVTGLVMASLAGCGAGTETTEQSPESSVVADTKDETGTEDEITSTEVIGGDTDEASDFAGAEDENIVLYAEIAEYGKYGFLSEDEFESVNNILVAMEDVLVYNGDGIEVGYIKNGSTVSITEYANSAWARFENPIAGTDYDYLYVMQKYVTDRGNYTLTTTEAEKMIKESLGNRDFDAPVFTSVTDDMDVYEFRIPMYYEDPEMDKPIYRIYSYYSKAEVSLLSYKTYSVICTEDTDDYIICQVYYKDLITDEEFNSYGH